jgi:hypothetical protein
MPHDIESIGGRRKISFEEWEWWRQRQSRHREAQPMYDDGFRRPSAKTASKIWDLLNKYNFPVNTILPKPYKTFMGDEDISQREFTAKRAFIIVLHTFVMAGLSHRQVTYLRVFDALCRGFSDQYLKIRGNVDSVRDMLDVTVKRCRRDLLLAGVDPKKLWGAVINWKDNPLFEVKESGTGKRAFKRVLLKDEESSVELGNFLLTIKEDPKYAGEQPSGIKVLFAEKKLLEDRPERRKVCAERPYNVVRLNDESERLLKLQESVTLYLDTSLFNEDYKKARDNEQKVLKFLKRIEIDARLPHAPRIQKIERSGGKEQSLTRWSERAEYVYYRSIEVGILKGHYKNESLTRADLRNGKKLDKCRWHIDKFDEWIKNNGQTNKRSHILQWLKACESRFGRLSGLRSNDSKTSTITPEMMFFRVDKAMRGWRDKVSVRLEEHDTARLHQTVFRNVYEEVKRLTGLKEIHSGFRRLLTRRYQPLHFWPTYVTSKNRREIGIREADENVDQDYPEQILDSYRRRWFKAKDPHTGKTCGLAGFDISSSQMQIIAAFLGDNKLRKVTMTPQDKPSFKEQMAKLVWQMHKNDKLKLRAGSDAILDYKDGSDERLQKLVKELLMRVSYGSTWWKVEQEQRSHPKIYGPGWEPASAGLFIKAFNEEYPGPQKFRQICRRAAELAYKQDPYRGLFFEDPFDHAEVRWNPVAREDCSVRSGDSLRINLPRGFKSDGGGLQDRNIKDQADGFIAGKPNKDGDYPVDRDELIRMAAPCLVHMLDAYYSSLVMSRIASEGVTTFVGIHDCWLVPKSQIVVLEEAMKWAAEEWYSGLEPIYKALLTQLEKDQKDKPFVEKAYEKWKKRQGEKWRKRCGGKWRPPFRWKSEEKGNPPHP